jgi:serine/threonine protein kinase
MTISQISTNDETPSLDRYMCPRCGTELPREAVFCNACGERLDKAKDLSSLLQNEDDIASRYRMTSLVRRRPFVTLYFATHTGQQGGQTGPRQPRTVALRDIDLSALDESAYAHALEVVQREYDLLRRINIPHILPVVDLRSSSRHLYTIAAPPGSPAGSVQSNLSDIREQYLSTLQDFLQSGLGLPSEQRVLQWMGALCAAVESLHSKGIVIGDLDPYAILLASQTGNAGDVRPLLLVSWLPPALRALLPQSTTATLSYFIAPEAIQGPPDARADVYSLGAILYLLLTGTTPGDSTRRGRGRLRSPQEINTRISHYVSECVMQALAIAPDERFQSVAAFAAGLRNPRFRRLPTRVEADSTAAPSDAQAETVRIIPLSRADLERWRAARSKLSTQAPASSPIPPRPVTPRPPLLDDEVKAVESDWELSRSTPGPGSHDVSFVPTMPITPVQDAQPLPEQREAEWEPDAPMTSTGQGEQVGEAKERAEIQGAQANEIVGEESRGARRMASIASSWKQRVTGLLPAFSLSRARASEQVRPERAVETTGMTGDIGDAAKLHHTWWERFKQMVLGQQQHVLAAAAIIETPLRVLPDQMYTLRINIMGREQADDGNGEQGNNEGRALGLSRMAHGDVVLIEVRSVLQESYAYIVQRATVSIPAEGYVAEVLIPMQPISITPIGRRDRLHIFFLNEHRHPLYEKPFAVEVFVSHHVKHGEEGHYTLPIPH